jgi:hypothetical protein
VTINIHAIDTRTGADFLMKDHVVIAEAAAKGLQNQYTSAATSVQRSARG